MTLPDERTRAIIYTRQFLLSLLDPKETPKVPRSVRFQAANCLRHFPSKLDLTNLKKNFEQLKVKDI
jgi:hypothetical protein